MIRTLRLLAAIAVATLLAPAWAVETDGGGRATPEERTAALARIQEVNEQVRMRRELKALYQAVEPYLDVHHAIAAGYAAWPGCTEGALGAHGVRFVRDERLEPTIVAGTPQALMYEPRADGSLRFVGVEYRVDQHAWHDAGHEDRPVLFGQAFRVSDTDPDAPFYVLHVWIGQFNPLGVFAAWNPLVGCDYEGTAESGRDTARR